MPRIYGDECRSPRLTLSGSSHSGSRGFLWGFKRALLHSGSGM